MENPMLDLWYQYHAPFIDEYTLSDIVLGFSELILTESRDTVISLEDHAFSLHPLLLEEVEEVLDSFQDLLYHVAALQSKKGFLIDPEPSCQSVFRRAENFRAIESAWDTFSRRIFLAHHWFRLHCFSLPEFSEDGSTWREVQRLQIQRDISKSRVTMGGSNTLTDCLGVSSHRHASPVMDCLAAKAPELELGLAPKRQSPFLSPSASSLNSPNQRTQGLDALCLDFDPSNTECYVDSPFVNTNSLQLSLLMFEASDQLAVMETLDEIELDMYGCLAEERVAKPGTGTYQSIGNLVSDNRAVCSAETTPRLSSLERSASVSPTSPLLEPRLSQETLSSFDFAMSDISVFRPSPPIYSPTCALLDNKLPLTNVLRNQSTSIIALIGDQRTKGGDDDGVAQLDVNEEGRSVSIGSSYDVQQLASSVKVDSIRSSRPLPLSPNVPWGLFLWEQTSSPESPPSNPSSETLSPQRTSSRNSPRVIARGSNVLMDSLGAPSCRRAPLAMDSLAGRAPAFELNLLSPLLFKSTSPFPAAPSPDDIERDFARLLVGTMDIGKGQPSSRLADTIILSPSIARSGQTLDLDPATIESYLNEPLTITNELRLSFSMIHTSGQFDTSESLSEIQIDTGNWSCKEPELGNKEKSVSDRQLVSSADTSSELLSFPVLDNVPLDPPTNVLRSIKQVGIQHLRISLGAPSCGFAVPETDEPIRYSAEILAEQRRAFKEDTPTTTPHLGDPSIIELGALRNKDYPPSHALEGPRFSDTSPRDSSSSLCSVRIDKGHGVSDTARTYLRANTPYSVSSSTLLDPGPTRQAPPWLTLIDVSARSSTNEDFSQVESPAGEEAYRSPNPLLNPKSSPSTPSSETLSPQRALHGDCSWVIARDYEVFMDCQGIFSRRHASPTKDCLVGEAPESVSSLLSLSLSESMPLPCFPDFSIPRFLATQTSFDVVGECHIAGGYTVSISPSYDILFEDRESRAFDFAPLAGSHSSWSLLGAFRPPLLDHGPTFRAYISPATLTPPRFPVPLSSSPSHPAASFSQGSGRVEFEATRTFELLDGVMSETRRSSWVREASGNTCTDYRLGEALSTRLIKIGPTSRCWAFAFEASSLPLLDPGPSPSYLSLNASSSTSLPSHAFAYLATRRKLQGQNISSGTSILFTSTTYRACRRRPLVSADGVSRLPEASTTIIRLWDVTSSSHRLLLLDPGPYDVALPRRTFAVSFDRLHPTVRDHPFDNIANVLRTLDFEEMASSTDWKGEIHKASDGPDGGGNGLAVSKVKSIGFLIDERCLSLANFGLQTFRFTSTPPCLLILHFFYSSRLSTISPPRILTLWNASDVRPRMAPFTTVRIRHRTQSQSSNRSTNGDSNEGLEELGEGIDEFPDSEEGSWVTIDSSLLLGLDKSTTRPLLLTSSPSSSSSPRSSPVMDPGLFPFTLSTLRNSGTFGIQVPTALSAFDVTPPENKDSNEGLENIGRVQSRGHPAVDGFRDSGGRIVRGFYLNTGRPPLLLDPGPRVASRPHLIINDGLRTLDFEEVHEASDGLDKAGDGHAVSKVHCSGFLIDERSLSLAPCELRPSRFNLTLPRLSVPGSSSSSHPSTISSSRISLTTRVQVLAPWSVFMGPVRVRLLAQSSGLNGLKSKDGKEGLTRVGMARVSRVFVVKSRHIYAKGGTIYEKANGLRNGGARLVIRKARSCCPFVASSWRFPPMVDSSSLLGYFKSMAIFSLVPRPHGSFPPPSSYLLLPLSPLDNFQLGLFLGMSSRPLLLDPGPMVLEIQSTLASFPHALQLPLFFGTTSCNRSQTQVSFYTRTNFSNLLAYGARVADANDRISTDVRLILVRGDAAPYAGIRLANATGLEGLQVDFRHPDVTQVQDHIMVPPHRLLLLDIRPHSSSQLVVRPSPMSSHLQVSPASSVPSPDNRLDPARGHATFFANNQLGYALKVMVHSRDLGMKQREGWMSSIRRGTGLIILLLNSNPRFRLCLQTRRLCVHPCRTDVDHNRSNFVSCSASPTSSVSTLPHLYFLLDLFLLYGTCSWMAFGHSRQNSCRSMLYYREWGALPPTLRTLLPYSVAVDFLELFCWGARGYRYITPYIGQGTILWSLWKMSKTFKDDSLQFTEEILSGS